MALKVYPVAWDAFIQRANVKKCERGAKPWKVGRYSKQCRRNFLWNAVRTFVASVETIIWRGGITIYTVFLVGLARLKRVENSRENSKKKKERIISPGIICEMRRQTKYFMEMQETMGLDDK